MTLDEAIKHAEEVAEKKENLTKIYKALNEDRLNEDRLSFAEEEKCIEEHRQLAEWLKELKQLREQKPKTGRWIDCCERDPWYKCSECGERVCGGYHKCCPNCGAKMEVNK